MCRAFLFISGRTKPPGSYHQRNQSQKELLFSLSGSGVGVALGEGVGVGAGTWAVQRRVGAVEDSKYSVVLVQPFPARRPLSAQMVTCSTEDGLSNSRSSRFSWILFITLVHRFCR